MDATQTPTVEQLQAQLAQAQAQLAAAQKTNAPTPEQIRADKIEAIRLSLDREPTPGEVLARLILLEREVWAASKGTCGTATPTAPAPPAPAPAPAAASSGNPS